jgi:hypothetical protein
MRRVDKKLTCGANARAIAREEQRQETNRDYRNVEFAAHRISFAERFGERKRCMLAQVIDSSLEGG